jgi:hypothetical protein
VPHAELSTPLQNRVVSRPDFGSVAMSQATEQSPTAHSLKVAPGEPLAFGVTCRQRDKPLQQLAVTKAVGYIDPVGIHAELIVADATGQTGAQCLVEEGAPSRRVIDNDGQRTHD